MNLLDALTIVPSSIPLALNLVNLAVWPRADEVVDDPASISVLIPARNEEDNIERAVRAALAVRPMVHEVIVCDDDSTDRTGQILELLAMEEPRLRVISGGPLPDGWVGKPHACHQLGQVATGELLVFVDADTALSPDAGRRLVALMQRYRSKVVTAFPRQQLSGLAEQLVVPLLVLTFTSWLPLDLVYKHIDPRFLVVNGQVMAFRSEAYASIGGYEAVRNAIVDDMEICRRAKELDQRVVFVDGQALATTRMYQAASEVWLGFSKNLFVGLGSSLVALAGMVTLYLLAFVFPYLRLGVELAIGAPSVAALVGVGFNLGARGLLARRHGHSLLSVLLHPLAVVVLLAIAVNSAIWARRGQIRWRGRTYQG